MLSITDIYRWLDGSEFMGERLVVQFARGSTRPRDGPGYGQERMAPRPRRTVHRMTITGLPFETSWQVRTRSRSPFDLGSAYTGIDSHANSIPRT